MSCGFAELNLALYRPRWMIDARIDQTSNWAYRQIRRRVNYSRQQVSLRSCRTSHWCCMFFCSRETNAVLQHDWPIHVIGIIVADIEGDEGCPSSEIFFEFHPWRGYI